MCACFYLVYIAARNVMLILILTVTEVCSLDLYITILYCYGIIFP